MRRFYLNLYAFLLVSILLTSVGANWFILKTAVTQ